MKAYLVYSDEMAYVEFSCNAIEALLSAEGKHDPEESEWDFSNPQVRELEHDDLFYYELEPEDIMSIQKEAKQHSLYDVVAWCEEWLSIEDPDEFEKYR